MKLSAPIPALSLPGILARLRLHDPLRRRGGLSRRESRPISIVGFFVLALSASSSALAQVNDPALTTPDAAWVWNLIIALIVLAATGASAALPLAAVKQWHGSWRVGAAIPLVILAIWVALILLSRVGDGQGHRLWPLEIFAWAMLNMIYMVAIMTAKRVFLKHDEENAAKP